MDNPKKQFHIVCTLATIIKSGFMNNKNNILMLQSVVACFWLVVVGHKMSVWRLLWWWDITVIGRLLGPSDRRRTEGSLQIKATRSIRLRTAASASGKNKQHQIRRILSKDIVVQRSEQDSE